MALPAEDRWPTYPMGTNDRALETASCNGTVDVALVWAPNLWAKQREDPAFADLHVIDPNPLAADHPGRGRADARQRDFPAHGPRRGDRRAERRRDDRGHPRERTGSRRWPSLDAKLRRIPGPPSASTLYQSATGAHWRWTRSASKSATRSCLRCWDLTARARRRCCTSCARSCSPDSRRGADGGCDDGQAADRCRRAAVSASSSRSRASTTG